MSAIQDAKNRIKEHYEQHGSSMLAEEVLITYDELVTEYISGFSVFYNRDARESFLELIEYTINLLDKNHTL